MFLPLLQKTNTINQIFITPRAKRSKPHNFRYCICITKPDISSIYTEVVQKQGNNQITVKQRKNGNSPDTDSNEFL